MKRCVMLLTGIIFFMRAADDSSAQTLYAYAMRGDQCEQEENYEEAVQWYKKALDGGCLTVLNNMAFAYEYLHDQEQAEKYYKMAIKAGNNNALINLAALYVDQKKFEKAKSLCYQLKADYSISELGRAHLAQICWELGDFEGTERVAKEAFALGNKKASYLIGRLYERDNNVPEATKWYAKACALGIEEARERLQELNYQQEEDSASITN